MAVAEYKIEEEQTPLERAVKFAGGQVALSAGIGISQPRLWNWLNRDKRVPAEFVKAICSLVDHQIQPWDLRPDVFERDQI